MRLDARARFLTLNDKAGTPGGRSIAIVDDIATAVAGWTAGTRVSPIWQVNGLSKKPRDLLSTFEGKHDFLFLGPVQPGLILSAFRVFGEGLFDVWVSAGCLNCILHTKSGRGSTSAISNIKEWAPSNGCVYEHWQVVDGEVKSVDISENLNSHPSEELAALAKLSARSFPSPLTLVMQEYAALMGSALTRSAYISPQDFENIKSVAVVTERIIDTLGDRLSVLDLQTRLTTLNAALSRFTSQAFSGVPPILQTECHFWIHSLLGTGTANIALMRLAGWIRGILGEARLREQIVSLKDRADAVPDLRMLTQDATLVGVGVLAATFNGEDEATPLVTYFSGRDGFSSHLQTLSAPLATISECNSWRSSLLTITHEVSHIFVRAVLGELYPDPHDRNAMDNARRYLAPSYQASNWFEAGCQLLLEGLVSIHQAESPGEEVSVSALQSALPEILLEWRREAQEILVHAFDFLYFYASDTKFYIKSIWSSWCSVPGIEDRVPEYLLRTLSAVSAPHLRLTTKVAYEAAKRETREALETLISEGGLLTDYAHTALSTINATDTDVELDNSLRERYSARLYLVRLVAIFMYSERIAARLFADSSVRSSKGHGVGALSLAPEPVGNPLTFLKDHLSDDPSEAESLWVLMALAYGDHGGDRHAT